MQGDDESSRDSLLSFHGPVSKGDIILRQQKMNASTKEVWCDLVTMGLSDGPCKDSR